MLRGYCVLDAPRDIEQIHLGNWRVANLHLFSELNIF